ncbi:MAG TPA: hypothetical protein VNG93_09645 [Candidatus Dormibacteraeota bacterium]|nr:hypothetical protein [Candidatus Dormibacteraeota bacterium]
MRKAISLLALVLLTACGSVSAGGSGALPADVGGLGQDCGQGGHLAEQISTDARSYSMGAPITVTLTATNTSAAPCASPFGCFQAIEVDSEAGTAVWQTPKVARPCPFLVRLLSPGETASAQVKVDAQLGAGVYSVTGPGKPLQDELGRSYFRVV